MIQNADPKNGDM